MLSCDTAKLGWPGCNKPSTSSPNLLVLFGHCKDSSLMLNPILIVDFQHICVCQRKRLNCLSPWQLQYCIPSESHAIEIVSGSVHHSGNDVGSKHFSDSFTRLAGFSKDCSSNRGNLWRVQVHLYFAETSHFLEQTVWGMLVCMARTPCAHLSRPLPFLQPAGTCKILTDKH